MGDIGKVDRTDAGLEGCRKGGMQERRDARKEGCSIDKGCKFGSEMAQIKTDDNFNLKGTVFFPSTLQFAAVSFRFAC